MNQTKAETRAECRRDWEEAARRQQWNDWLLMSSMRVTVARSQSIVDDAEGRGGLVFVVVLRARKELRFCERARPPVWQAGAAVVVNAKTAAAASSAASSGDAWLRLAQAVCLSTGRWCVCVCSLKVGRSDVCIVVILRARNDFVCRIPSFDHNLQEPLQHSDDN